MKLTSILSLGLVFALTSTAPAQKINKHNFSTKSWNTLATNKICGVCHAPHDKSAAAKYGKTGLLWNHKLSSVTYTLYDTTWSSSIQGTVVQPTGSTKMCLACHDGSVELGHIGNVTSPPADKLTGNKQVPSSNYGGNDLTGTHPVSITYEFGTGTGKDPGLKDPVTTDIGISGKIKDVLEFNMVQCASCHDVHETEVPTGAGGLLRVDNTNSALCLVCHDK